MLKILLALALFACPLAAQREFPIVLSPEVWQQLEANWDSTNAKQHERAYCLAGQFEPRVVGDTAYVVYQANRVVSPGDSPIAILADCGSWPMLHVHTPTTCEMVDMLIPVYASCVLGGPMAGMAYPSRNDRAHLEASTAPFFLIQYDRVSVIAVYPRR